MPNRRPARLARFILPGIAAFFVATGAAAAAPKSADNLMVVLRESLGANKLDEALQPAGKARAQLADGRTVEIEMAWWALIGDMHLRFVFDGPQTLVGATPQELAQLNVAAAPDALALVLTNIRRVYGAPQVSPWMHGISQVQGDSEDLDSSYFLDRPFWRELAKAHPEGLVVAVPSRGSLLFVPAANTEAVALLKAGIAKLHASGEQMRVSSALYLFKDDAWSVYQPAVPQP